MPARQKRSQRHHVVPQFILKRFTDDVGRLWVLDKRRSGKLVAPSTPDKVFVEKNVNTFTESDGRKNDNLERDYSILESRVAPIVGRLVAAGRAARAALLSDEDRNLFDNFVYHQQKRPADAFDRVGGTENVEARFKEALDKRKAEGRIVSAVEEAHLLSPDTIVRMVQRSKVLARASGSVDVIRVLARRWLTVATPASGRASFIIGDYPINCYGGDGDLENPETELWFPIASDVAICLASTNVGFQTLSDSNVRSINQCTYEQSNVVGGCSKRLLEAILKRSVGSLN